MVTALTYHISISIVEAPSSFSPRHCLDPVLAATPSLHPDLESPPLRERQVDSRFVIIETIRLDPERHGASMCRQEGYNTLRRVFVPESPGSLCSLPLPARSKPHASGHQGLGFNMVPIITTDWQSQDAAVFDG